MAVVQVSASPRRFGETARRDGWWVQPLATFLGLSMFIVYSTWAAFQNAHYEFGPYLSPFYSPLLFGPSAHAWFGAQIPWWPAALPVLGGVPHFVGARRFPPDVLLLSGAYYKAFWADPPSCTVGEPRSHYRGEQSFPLILQNVHRYFLYIALAFLVVLLIDVWKALWFEAPDGTVSFGVGVGTLILAANVTLLGGYTLGLPFAATSDGRPHRRAWRTAGSGQGVRLCQLFEPSAHGLGMGQSVFSGVLGFYIRLCSMGIWSDLRLF